MASNETLAPRFKGIIEDCGYTVHNDYGGRGMHGRTCLGVSDPEDAHSAMEMVGTIMERLLNSEERASYEREDALYQFAHMVQAMAVDTFGNGVIAYFPGFELGEVKE